MKHTTGPWITAPFDTEHGQAPYAIHADKYVVAMLDPNAEYPKELAANARLIAASPDLYACTRALSLFLELFEKGAFAVLLTEMEKEPGMFNLVRHLRETRAQVDKAIAKAESGDV